MATVTSIFIAGPAVNFSLAATTASARQTLSTNQLFAINATTDITIAFGNSHGQRATASGAATEFRIPAGQTAELDWGSYYDEFMVYNLSVAAGTVYYMELRRN